MKSSVDISFYAVALVRNKPAASAKKAGGQFQPPEQYRFKQVVRPQAPKKSSWRRWRRRQRNDNWSKNIEGSDDRVLPATRSAPGAASSKWVCWIGINRIAQNEIAQSEGDSGSRQSIACRLSP